MILVNLTSYLKHYVKLVLGRTDIPWYFNRFEERIAYDTKAQSALLIEWADTCAAESATHERDVLFEESSDPVVKQGFELRRHVMSEFKDKHKMMRGLRLLIHIPNEKMSPAGYSLFSNMRESFQFLGIETDILLFGEPIMTKLESFKPTVFISSDHASWLDKINWDSINEYRKSHKLLIGLTAGLEEYGNTPLAERLAWAKEHSIDFYYSYRDNTYIQSRSEYKPFFDAGFPLFSIPFGANPLIHYPVPIDTQRDIEYSLIASAQGKTKGKRYFQYLSSVVSKHRGLIAGVGWSHTPSFTFNRNRDRYIYSRSKIGINIHLDEQIYWACEVNERTYQLAACGVPQVIDHAKLLDTLFSPGTLFVVNTPKEYAQQFEFILTHPTEAQTCALKAQKEVFEKYTTFHRASNFATMLATHFNL